MAWGKNGTPNTLSGTSVDLTISDQTSTKFNMFLFYSTGRDTAGDNGFHRLGNGGIDSGSNYARRQSQDGGADATATSQDKLRGIRAPDTNPGFMVEYAVNISSYEKLIISFDVMQYTAGASAAPKRSINVGKWVNTSSQFDNVQYTTALSDVYNVDSNLSALGTD